MAPKIRNNGTLSLSESQILIDSKAETKTASTNEIKSVEYELINKPNELIAQILLIISCVIVFTNLTNMKMIGVALIVFIIAFILRSALKQKWDNVTISFTDGSQITYSVQEGKGIIDAAEIEKYLSEKRIGLEKKKEYEIELNISIKYEKLENLANNLKDLEAIKLVNIDEFKSIVVKNEELINQKGGDQVLFSFLKIDTFLKDYKNKISSDIESVSKPIDIATIKNRIKEETLRNDIRKTGELFGDIAARLEGRQVKGFDAKLDQLFELGNKMKPYFEGLNNTLTYYQNIGISMLAFYLSDKKIQYFEIYSSFEKMGVFDSTWQKNVLLKLDSIENRLALIGDQLIQLNSNFESLVESTNNITTELKNINSSIVTNNLLQALTFFQTWRINQNLKNG